MDRGQGKGVEGAGEGGGYVDGRRRRRREREGGVL